MSGQEPDAAGWAIFKQVPTLHIRTVEKVHAALSDLLSDNEIDLRAIHLGGVVELITTLGRTPDTGEYDYLYEERKDTERSIPERTSLNTYYGGWVAVLIAAVDLYRLGTTGRVPNRNRAPRRVNYTRFDLREALILCEQRIGHEPWQTEYLLWSRAELRARAQGGSTDFKLPSMTPFRRLYGRKEPFRRALEDAHDALRRQPDFETRRRDHLTALCNLARERERLGTSRQEAQKRGRRAKRSRDTRSATAPRLAA